MTTLHPGDQLGRYLIESRLGAGGMGVVYLARDQPLDRQVALKVLAPGLAAEPGFRRRFADAASAAAAIEHRHLLPIYDAGESDGAVYLAMRFVPGFDLGTLLARDGALPADRAIQVVGQVGEALDAVHSAGFVHRNVKPANVLIRPDEYPYLADFGLARTPAASDSRLIPAGQVAGGSADYVAPELFDGRVADARSDLYALACLAFACLTGRPPFRHPDDAATLYAHADEAQPALTSLRADLPAILARALAKDPAERYQSVSEFVHALRHEQSNYSKLIHCMWP